jgi:hypothetical protein
LANLGCLLRLKFHFLCSSFNKQMIAFPTPQLILRLGLAATFGGHGFMAIQLHEAWLLYFNCVGISNNLAAWLLPFIGYLDLLVALLLLIKPHRAIFYWAFGWLVLVAFIRPICGESWVELVKRGGYIACALGLIVLTQPSKSTTTNAARDQ